MSLSTKYHQLLGKLFRLLPSFKGKKKIARVLFSESYLRAPNNNIVGEHNIIYDLPNFIDSIGFQLLVDGIYERDTVEYLIRSLPKDAVFIDVGANIGTISLPVAKYRNDVTIYSIEASKNIFNYLSKNIKSNGLKNVKAFQIALSNHSSEGVSFYAPSDKFGKGSFAPVFTSNAESVITQTLDDFRNNHQISNVQLIKIDVEGFEYLVISGALELLSAENAPDILFEFVDWAEEHAHPGNKGIAQKMLLDLGYKLYAFSSINDKKPFLNILTNGAALIYASKKVNIND